jgi:hypothetical protein
LPALFDVDPGGGVPLPGTTCPFGSTFCVPGAPVSLLTDLVPDDAG